MHEKLRFHSAKNEVSSPEGCRQNLQHVTSVQTLTPEQKTDEVREPSASFKSHDTRQQESS